MSNELIPKRYKKMLQKLEDLEDSIIAHKRINSSVEFNLVSHEEFQLDFFKEFGFKFSELEPLDESEFE